MVFLPEGKARSLRGTPRLSRVTPGNARVASYRNAKYFGTQLTHNGGRSRGRSDVARDMARYVLLLNGQCLEPQVSVVVEFLPDID